MPTTEIHSVAELEEFLSRPSEADIGAIARLDGDLLILGAGGKMGPSLARRARRAADKAGVGKSVIAVARFSENHLRASMTSEGIETLAVDLLEPGALSKLPDVPNVIFMAARKFGTTGSEDLTWAMNTLLPGLVVERYRASRIVSFSTGNVYPLRDVTQGGAVESTPVAPQSEYAQSALGRERMFEYGSRQWGTAVTILRLNYAIDLRYGVLLDIGTAVFERRPIDLRMAFVNIIWQGDANSVCLQSFAHCQAPPLILNLTGPDTLSVKFLAEEFGHRFNVQPTFVSEEMPTALLSNAAKAHQMFGCPSVTTAQMIDWTAAWISSGGPRLNKPTHFEVRDGKF
ncbi:MAG TPA: NAD-dependent epimerase/dehydratase family protein [Methylomirabilota bacterium]|jgi:nucleoside-diphosphate-sugar epimerase|nr:NAD-dependent epimerase/dehydratase family protein [Methylomirabilota bacterium]